MHPSNHGMQTWDALAKSDSGVKYSMCVKMRLSNLCMQAGPAQAFMGP